MIQGFVLMAGLYLGISRGYQALNGLVEDPVRKSKIMVLPMLFALAVVNILLKLYMG